MKGLIGVVANDFARVSIFSMCITNLQERMLRDGIDVKTQWLIGTDYVGGYNSLVEITLHEDHDWLWIMGDDHAFSPTVLSKLLSHDVPIVVPVCLQRYPPYTPVTYTEQIDEESYLPLYLPDTPNEGLIEIAVAGSAGMLVHREVFEAMESPWFEWTPKSEDFLFVEKAKKLGFSIYCDLSARIGHVTTATLTPITNGEGEWMMGVTVGLGTQISVPFEMMVQS
jgi:hypothetical protein